MHASATLIHSLKGHTYEVGRLLFSPDRKILVATDDSFITLWDVETGTLRSTSEEVDDIIFDIVFSPDNKWIAAASGDGYGRVWNVESGELVHTLEVEDERMLSVAFSADSKLIATGSEIMRVWDVATGKLLHTLSVSGDQPLSITAVFERSEYPPEIGSVDFSPDGKFLLSGCGNTSTVSIWKTESWKLEHTIRGYYSACFSPDGMHLAVPTDEHEIIHLYDTRTWQLQSTLKTPEQETFASRFSRDSKTIATYSRHQIKLWCVENGKVIRTFRDPTRKLSSPTFSPDGKVLIAGARKCGLRVWDVESGDCLFMFEPEDGDRWRWNPSGGRAGPPAFEILFGDGKAKVAVAFPDGSIRLWDVRWESEST
ncbi:WD40 repeat-like protein, partial [Aureobasidium melanogenum]